MASATDKFRKTANNTSTTITSAIIGSGDTSTTLSNPGRLPTDTAIDLVVDRVDANGNKTPSKREFMRGVLSGSTFGTLVRGIGGSTAQAHASGAVVEAVWDESTWNDAVDGVLVSHNQDGTLKSGSVSSAALTQSVNLETYRQDVGFDFVVSGCAWTQTSGFIGAMTGGFICFSGVRTAISSIASRTFTPSKDTYIDIPSNNGTPSYPEVANSAAEPVLTAGCIRVAAISTDTNGIVGIRQFGVGPYNTFIYQQNPVLKTMFLPSGNFFRSSDMVAAGNVWRLNGVDVTDFNNGFKVSTPGSLNGIQVPLKGSYHVTVHVSIQDSGLGNTILAGLGVNTSTSPTLWTRNGAQSNPGTIEFNKNILLNAGDIVYPMHYSSGTGNYRLNSGNLGDCTYMSINLTSISV